MKISNTFVTSVAICCIMLAGVATGCKKDKNQNPDENLVEYSKKGPLIEDARMISERAEFVTVIRSPNAVLDANIKLLGEKSGVLRAIDRDFEQMEKLLGLSFTSRENWEQTGIDMDATTFLVAGSRDSGYVNEPALFVKIKDRNLTIRFIEKVFETSMTSDTPEALTFDKNDEPLYFCGDYLMFGDGDTRALCAPKGAIKSGSLAENSVYQTFTRDVMRDDAVAGIFLPARGSIHGEMLRELAREIAGNYSPFDAGKMLSWFLNATGAGGSIHLDGDRWAARSWIGLTPAGVDFMKRVAVAKPEIALSNLVTKDVMGAMVFRVNGEEFWKWGVSMLSTYGEMELEEGLEEVSEQLGVDFEPGRDIFAGHTGNVLLANYVTPGGEAMDDYYPLFMTTYASDADTNRILAILDKLVAKTGAPVSRTSPSQDASKPLTSLVLMGEAQITFGNARVSISRATTREEHLLAVHYGVSEGNRLPAEVTKKVDGEVGGILDSRTFKSFLVKQNEMSEAEAALAPDRFWVKGGLRKDGFLIEGTAEPIFTSDVLTEAIAAEKKRRLTDDVYYSLNNAAWNAKSYFTTEQKYSLAGGAEPWHKPDPSEPYKKPGFPVEWAEYVFPGGANYTLVSGDYIPSPDKPLPPFQSDDPFTNSVLAKLGIPPQFLTGEWRVTYTTGPGKGDGATATIVFERDWDPKSEFVHRVEQQVSIDPGSQEVLIYPPMTTNEFE